MTATHATVAFDWIKAYSLFIGASLFAGMAWHGYQCRPKTGQSAKI